MKNTLKIYWNKLNDRLLLMLFACLLSSVSIGQNLSTDEALVQKIINNLYAYVGSDRPLPKWKIDSTPQGATYKNQTIKIDPGLIQLCKDQFPKNAETALAFFVAHEFFHWLQDVHSQKCIPFGAGNSERHADMGGAFYAFYAGYKNISALIPRLFELFYPKFSIKNINPNYPSKQERTLTGERLKKDFDNLVAVFEVGNLFLLKKDFDRAEQCYQYLTRFLKDKVIHYNLGLLYFSQVSNIYFLELATPEEVDQYRGKKDLSQEEKSNKEELLRKAKMSFEKAIAIDSTYHPALLGLYYIAAFQDFKPGYEDLKEDFPLKNSSIEEARIIRIIDHALSNSSKIAKEKAILQLIKLINKRNRVPAKKANDLPYQSDSTQCMNCLLITYTQQYPIDSIAFENLLVKWTFLENQRTYWITDTVTSKKTIIKIFAHTTVQSLCRQLENHLYRPLNTTISQKFQYDQICKSIFLEYKRDKQFKKPYQWIFFN